MKENEDIEKNREKRERPRDKDNGRKTLWTMTSAE
jgi:hypothetical protein